MFMSLALHPLFIDHFHPLCTNLLVSTDSTNSKDARSRLNHPLLNHSLVLLSFMAKYICDVYQYI